MRSSSASLAVATGDSSIVRNGPMLLGGAAVVALVVTVLAAFVDAGIARPGAGAYLVSGVVMTAVDLAVAVAFAALSGAGAMQAGRYGTVSFTILVVSSFGMVIAEALLRVDFALGNAAYGIVGPLQAVGLVLVGFGIIRARRWSSWRRFSALALGLYIPLLMVPLLVASGGTSLLALGGYHLLVLAIAIGWGIEAGDQA
jgi:hypothetical protein